MMYKSCIIYINILINKPPYGEDRYLSMCQFPDKKNPDMQLYKNGYP